MDKEQRKGLHSNEWEQHDLLCAVKDTGMCILSRLEHKISSVSAAYSHDSLTRQGGTCESRLRPGLSNGVTA